MRDEITRSDGFADGMLAASAAAYPVVRGAARMVGRAIDESRRRALVARGQELARNAAEIIPLVRQRLEAIETTLVASGFEGTTLLTAAALTHLEERVRWFSPANLRGFIEANKVEPLVVCGALGDFLVAPVREAIDAIRTRPGARNRAVHRLLNELEEALVIFAAERFDADISRPGEASFLIRSSMAKTARIAMIVILGIAGVLAIAYFSLL